VPIPLSRHLHANGGNHSPDVVSQKNSVKVNFNMLCPIKRLGKPLQFVLVYFCIRYSHSRTITRVISNYIFHIFTCGC
jgi:hypothetical protein